MMPLRRVMHVSGSKNIPCKVGDRGIGVFAGVAIGFATIMNAFLYAKGFWAISADESGRTLAAYEWLHNGRISPSTWLPLHNVTVGLALKVYFDLFLTPRVVTWVLGLVSLSCLIWLSCELFKDKRVVAFSALLGAFLPQRVILSAVPLAEIMFVSAVTASMVFLIRWLRSSSTSNLAISAICLAISGMIRYEGWGFSAALLILLVWLAFLGRSMERLWNAIWIACILAVFPVYWMGIHYWQTGDPFYFVKGVRDYYGRMFGDSVQALLRFNVLTQFFLQNLHSLNLLGITSLATLTVRDPAIRKWTAVAFGSLVLTALSTLFIHGLPVHNFWRPAAVWGVLLVPFTAHRILVCESHDAPLKYVWRYPLLPITLILFCSQIWGMTKHSTFSSSDLATGRYLARIVESQRTPNDTKILIETSDWSYLNVVIASQHPDRFVYNSGWDPLHPSGFIVSPEERADRSKLANLGIRFLLFKSQQLRETVAGMPEVTLLQDFGDWALYRLEL